MATDPDYRRRLEADAEDARKALNAARARYDKICAELDELRRAERAASRQERS